MKYEPIARSFTEEYLKDLKFELLVSTGESELAVGIEPPLWLSISLNEISSELKTTGRFGRSYASINIYPDEQECLLMLSFPIGESHKKRVAFKDLNAKVVTTYFDGYLSRLEELIPML